MNNTATLFGFLANANDNLQQGLVLTVVGMGIVFTVLLLIMIMLFMMAALVKRNRKLEVALAKKQAAKSPSPARTATPSKSAASDIQTNSDEITPLTLAIITAAVTATLKQPARIRRVNLVQGESNAAWRQHGRERIHGSHRPRG